MALLFVATILSVVTAKLKIPFSLTLVVVGCAIGIAIRAFPSLESLGTVKLSNNLLTYILLPTLVFQAAFAIDSRMLGQNFLPVMVLAVPAVLLSFAIAGFGSYLLVGSDARLPLTAALLFGVFVTSTDSTAMSSIFHEIGAPKRLAILAEGENLFNDAISIVIFQMVIGYAGIQTGMNGIEITSAGQAIGSFAVNFFGGLAAGWVMGHLIGKVIEIIRDDDLVEILLTTTSAYLAFFVSQQVLHVSGIMAVVGVGLVLGSAGITKYTPSTIEYLSRFWEYLAFIASSLIFLLIGMEIVRQHNLGVFAGPMAIGIVMAGIARAVSIYGLFPIVNHLPNIERVDARYQTVMVWGGMRGAMTLVLALSLPAYVVATGEGYIFRDILIAMSFGAVVFSLLVQGLTLQPLAKWLGLHRVGVPDQFLRDETLLEAKGRARQRITELRKAGMFSESVTSELETRYGAEQEELRGKLNDLRARGLLGSREEFRLLKREYLLVEKRVYQDLFHRGQLSEKVLHELHHSIELQLDHLRYGGSFPAWTIHSPVRWKIEAALFKILETVFPWGNSVQHYRLNRIADLYEQHWGRLMASQKVLEELERIENQGSNAPDLVFELRDLYRVWNANARQRLDAVADQYPEYATKVQQLMAARLCLQAEEEVIEELEQLDVLPDREARAMLEEVQRKLRRLRKKPLEELRPRPRELLAKVPFFRSLPPDEFDRIVDLLRPRTFLAEEVVVREGDIGDSMFLIGRGVVRVTVGSGGISPVPLATLLAGDFFGEMAVLSANPRNASVTTVTHSTLYELTRADLEAIQIVCPTIQQVLEATFAERVQERKSSAAARAVGTKIV
jgi:CPA1 family monovalent cation:H+ antiporter